MNTSAFPERFPNLGCLRIVLILCCLFCAVPNSTAAQAKNVKSQSVEKRSLPSAKEIFGPILLRYRASASTIRPTDKTAIIQVAPQHGSKTATAPEAGITDKTAAKYSTHEQAEVACAKTCYSVKVHVPLFTPMLSLIPFSLQNVVIPLSTAVMGIVGVWVQWHGLTRAPGHWTSWMFSRILGTAVLSMLILLVADVFAVEHIYINATGEDVSYAVGFSYPSKEPCQNLSRADCIKGELTLDPAKIATYFGFAELLLTLSYTGFMASFGALVGVLVIARGKKFSSSSQRI